jgi:hypothetical protein
MKHKHYDMIVAWAEGKQIQNFNENTGEWQDLIAPPYWIQNFQYRIKPEEKQPVVRWQWAYPTMKGWTTTNYFYNDKEILNAIHDGCIKLEYTRTEFPE